MVFLEIVLCMPYSPQAPPSIRISSIARDPALLAAAASSPALPHEAEPQSVPLDPINQTDTHIFRYPLSHTVQFEKENSASVQSISFDHYCVEMNYAYSIVNSERAYIIHTATRDGNI